MKVIGKTDSGFLVDISAGEMKALLSQNDERRKDVNKEIRVGTEITFSVALQNLNLVRDMTLGNDYDYAVRYARDLKLYVEKISTTLEKLNLPVVEMQKSTKNSA